MSARQRASLADAIALQREGNLPAAIEACRALLETAPGDPRLLGLTATMLLQQGRSQEAEVLLKRALAAGGAPKVRLRNLYGYFALLGQEKRLENARTLAAGQIPDWPEGAPPNAGERKMLLLLAGTFLKLEQPAKAGRLLGQAFPDPGDDGAVLNLAGRIRLALGDAEGAMPLLQRAVEAAPDDFRPLIALGATQSRLGRRHESLATAVAFSRRFPFHAEPRRDGQRSTVLVLNPPPDSIPGPDALVPELHFRANFPSQLPGRLGDRHRFLSLFESVAPDAAPWAGEGASVVLNNLVNEERMGTREAAQGIRALLERIGLPVINPPERIARVSREKNAARLSGIPGLKVPRIRRYRVAQRGIEALLAEIGQTIGYPMILRPPAAHSSADSLYRDKPKTAFLVANAEEARDALAEARWPEVYAIEFVDLRKKEGWYRKIRATFMGDETIISSGGYFDQWMVSGWRRNELGIAFYRANPQAIERARAFLRDPEGELGKGCLETLRLVRERIGLDIFGMDFDVDDTGGVVLFEATPAMIFPHPTQRAPEDLWMPEEPLNRIHAAFDRLVERRIAEGPEGLS